MGACGLFLGAEDIGRVTWQTEGSKLQLQADCPFAPGWIYRLVLQTDRGEHRLGVMLPEEDRFILRRELPAGELPHRALIDRTLPGESHLPGLPLALSAFSESRLEGAKSALWQDIEYYLFPLPPGGPCACAPFLCLTTFLEQDKACYGVFCKENGVYAPLSDRLRRETVL